MKVVCVVQARMGSARLPGKVLRRVGTQAVLTHVLARTRRIPGVDEVHVTTTQDRRDDAIVNRCRGAGVGWTRGQVPMKSRPGRNDVLTGYVVAAAATGADVVVRVTADCPFLDPLVVRAVLREFLDADAGAVEYASNVNPPSWYDGCDVEVFRTETLMRAAREAGPDQREHVTTWMRDRVRTLNVALQDPDAWCPDLKLSVDDASDLERVRRTWRELRGDRAWFGWADVAAAYLRAYAPPVLRRALRIYGRAASADQRVAAFLRGAVASSAGAVPPPQSGRGSVADRVAYMLGYEEVAERLSTPLSPGDRDRVARYARLVESRSA